MDLPREVLGIRHAASEKARIVRTEVRSRSFMSRRSRRHPKSGFPQQSTRDCALSPDPEAPWPATEPFDGPANRSSHCWPPAFGADDGLLAFPSSTAVLPDRTFRMAFSKNAWTVATISSAQDFPLNLNPLGRSLTLNPCFRPLKTAPLDRVAQSFGARLIHRAPNGQWTRMDNSTACRGAQCDARSRLAKSRSRNAFSFMNPSASCWS